MNIICRVLGHNWGKGQFKKNCKRKNCSAFKSLMEYKYAGKYGESVFKWEVYDIDKYNLR